MNRASGFHAQFVGLGTPRPHDVARTRPARQQAQSQRPRGGLVEFPLPADLREFLGMDLATFGRAYPT